VAVRPEALTITPSGDARDARIHRVTDYGAHAIVDLELPDGFRLKATVPDAREWTRVQLATLAPRAFAAYRDNVVAYRS
jgi:putative spermidine/putrescine transport system ATP-binding protein